MKNNFLYIKKPDLFKQIHPTKNISVDLLNLTCGSNKKIWWKCITKGHEWEATIGNRSKSNGTKCPYCINQKACIDNCIATLNAFLAKEWHPTKNGNLTPYDFVCNSGVKVWWKCITKGHEWKSVIVSRQNGRNCPYCSDKKVCIDNCLAINNPKVSHEWHPTKNGDLTPFDITCGSEKKIWWICDRNSEHEWVSSVYNRKRGDGCPKCSVKGYSYIERKFYYYLKLIFPSTISGHNIEINGEKIEIDIYIPEISLAIEYDGYYYHKNEDNIKRDIRKNDILSSNHINLLRIREEKLPSIHDVEFFHNYTKKSSLKETLTKILNYISNNFNISIIKKQKIEEVKNIDFENHIIPKGFFIYPFKKDSLAIKNPELSKEWCLKLNGDLTPENVSCGTRMKVWWKCSNGHIYKSSIVDRNKGVGCVLCYNDFKRGQTIKKPVKQIDIKTNECINTFTSIMEAYIVTSVNKSCISGVCTGKYKTAGGFKWEFIKNPPQKHT